MEPPFMTSPFDEQKVREAIEARNGARAEARLPILSVEAEIKKARSAHEASQRAALLHALMRSPLRARVEAKLLARTRRASGNRHRSPSGTMGLWALSSAVQRQMEKLFRRFGDQILHWGTEDFAESRVADPASQPADKGRC